MSMKMLAKAAFKTRNFTTLAVILIISALLNFLTPLLLAGIAIYLGLVVQTLASSKFKLECARDEELDGLQKLSWECDDLYRKINRRLARNMRSKASGIIKQKNEIMEYFKRNCDDPVRQRIMEQVLKLVSAYLNLMNNYSVRSAELSPDNLNELVRRINYNNRKLGYLKNYDAVLELTKTVEMDEKLLRDMKQERGELERINVRLDYIESTIGGFKHRILSPDSDDPESEEIEDVINEASALDNVLNERSKNRMRL